MEFNFKNFLETVENFDVSKVKIDNIQQGDIKKILDLKFNIFSHVYDDQDELNNYTMNFVDWPISKKMTYDGKIIGAYLFGKYQLKKVLELEAEDNHPFKFYIDVKKYFNKRGIQGVTLMIKNEFRGYGLGNTLKNIPKKMNIDYIFGLHYKTLGNLKHWLNRRILIAENDILYVTLENFK